MSNFAFNHKYLKMRKANPPYSECFGCQTWWFQTINLKVSNCSHKLGLHPLSFSSSVRVVLVKMNTWKSSNKNRRFTVV